MAEVVVGGAFLSAFLQVLFDRLAPKEITKLFGGKEPVVDVLRDVRIVVKLTTRLVNDAEEKQIIDEDVGDWLDELKDVVYRVDDLVDTIESEALRLEVEADQPSSSGILADLFTNTGFDVMVKNEATELLCRFKSLLDQKDNLGLREGYDIMKPHSQRPPIPLAGESSVYGRNGDKEAIVDLLLSGDESEENLCVIPIIGMGGIGKTTLAQLVYDDSRVKDSFDLRAWVTISDDFDIYKITKLILEKVTSQECRYGDLFEIQRNLRDALRGKKFLLVHDDVWNENYHLWHCLRSSYEYGAEGSKVIVTTRSTIVASIMASGKTTTHYLSDLSTEDCWLLFSQHAFRNKADAHAHQDLQVIGREIVRKCKGLPLAIISLGGLLRSERNPKKWENILKSEVWDELYRKEKNILPALWLSYRRMPTHLKRCFSYCSIFPKSYEFEKERIILLWMAEGFLLSDNQYMTMEEVGDEYFEDLVSRSLLQKSSHNVSIFLMHDLIHDLSMFVSRGFCFRLDESNGLHRLASQTRHLSFSHEFATFEGVCKAKNLRTFIESCEFTHSRLPRRFLLTSGRFLRVLALHGSFITEISDSIENLIHLRYLDLSYSSIKELRNSICRLYNSQTLLLLGCHSLRELPKDMERLINLRHLDITGVPLNEMTFEIKNMKSLKTLSKIVVGDGDKCGKIKELKQFQPFKGRLEISRIEKVVDAEETMEADMMNKRGITDLSLIWSSESVGNADSSKIEREILDSLQPHTSLRTLAIEYYRGTIFPDWLGHDSFINVVSIRLENCKSCCILPPLGRLPFLKELQIVGFDNMERMGDEIHGHSSQESSFRCLERLEIRDMLRWKECSFDSEDGRIVFPCLATLRLVGCPELNIDLRSRSPESLSKLKHLFIDNCKMVPDWDLRRLPSLEDLFVGDWERDSFPHHEFLPESLVSINIGFSNMAALNGEAFRKFTSLERLSIIGCPRLRCLPERGLPLSLAVLRIWGCHQSLEKRCEKDKGEDWPKISHVPIVSVLLFQHK